MPYTLAEARELVRTQVQADLDPTLSLLELEDCLTRTAPASVWGAATAYTVGAVVIPTVRTGHRYRAVVGGTSGATEPTWVLGARSRQSDGTTLVWEEAGADTTELYDLRAATYAAWQLKLAKAQRYYNFSADGQTVNRKDVVDNIETNMRAWAPVGVF